jgi:hypothetical protein
MRTARLFALLLASISTAAPAQPDAGAAAGDELTGLLSRLARTQVRLEKVYRSGFTVSSVIEELEKNDEVSSRKEREVRVTHVKGVSTSRLLRATEDGKPDLQEAQRELDEQRKRRESRKQSGASGDLANPFRQEEQPLYAFRLLGPDPARPEHVRVGFAPRGVPSPEQITGEAVVDVKRAAVVGMRCAPSKVPTFVDEAQVVAEFAVESPEGPVLSKLELHARGGILFFEKRLRSVSVFSDYGPQPESRAR